MYMLIAIERTGHLGRDDESSHFDVVEADLSLLGTKGVFSWTVKRVHKEAPCVYVAAFADAATAEVVKNYFESSYDVGSFLDEVKTLQRKNRLREEKGFTYGDLARKLATLSREQLAAKVTIDDGEDLVPASLEFAENDLENVKPSTPYFVVIDLDNIEDENQDVDDNGY